MAKLGAILAQGIIDAGGRNMTVSLQSRTGHTNMMAVVGMLVSLQENVCINISLIVFKLLESIRGTTNLFGEIFSEMSEKIHDH